MRTDLQARFEDESPVMQAGEGYSAEVRMLIRLSEVRTQIKTLQDEEKDLANQIKAHIKETGELVQTDTQRASLEQSETVSYDTDMLALVLGARYERCVTESFDKAKLDALIALGEVDPKEVESARIVKTTDKLPIRAVKP